MDDKSTNNNGQTDLEVNKEGEMSTISTISQPATKILVNDVTPPPATMSSPIEVNSNNSTDINTSEESLEQQVVDPESVQNNNEGEAVVPAPDEVEDETNEDMGRTDSQITEPDTSNPSDDAKSTSAEPTSEMNAQSSVSSDSADSVVMGVAASQLGAKPHHRNNRKFAALVTVFVTLLLAGTAVYVYISTNENTKETSQNITTNDADTQKEEVTTPASTEDVDQALNEIEQSVNAIDDEADLSEKDLSDQTLGL